MLYPTPDPNIKASIAQVKGLIGSLTTVKAQFCKDIKPSRSIVLVPNCHMNLPATDPLRPRSISFSLFSSSELKPTLSCLSLAFTILSTVFSNSSVFELALFSFSRLA